MLKSRHKNIYSYNNWLEHFQKDLENMYEYLIRNLEKNQILFKSYDFDDFCKLIYNKSSKRIPLY